MYYYEIAAILQGALGDDVMTGKKLLIVDDEQHIRELLALYVAQAGFTVVTAADGGEALLLVQSEQPDLVVLDVMLPVVDGIEVCRQLRKRSQIPIIMLTARTQDDDRILGLEMGAADYVAKPFNPREVVARINAVLRRAAAPLKYAPADVITIADLSIDMAAHSVSVNGIVIALTNKELELLWQLVSHAELVLSREQLLELVWDYCYAGDTRTVDTHVKRLRKKLGVNPNSVWNIKTIWGIGYKFEVKS